MVSLRIFVSSFDVRQVIRYVFKKTLFMTSFHPHPPLFLPSLIMSLYNNINSSNKMGYS